MLHNIYDVIIVWWWIMWLSCAYMLKDTHLSIAIIDQHGLGNSFQSSHDYTRNFRIEYWWNQDMEKLAMHARNLREQFELQEWIQALNNTGSLYLWKKATEYSEQAFHQMSQNHHPVKWLNKDVLEDTYGIHHMSYWFVDLNWWVLDAKAIMQTLIKKLSSQHSIDIITDKITSYTSWLVQWIKYTYRSKKIVLCPWPRHNSFVQIKTKTIPEKQICVNFNCTNIKKYLHLPMFIYPESWFYWWPVSSLWSIKIVTHNNWDSNADLEKHRTPSANEIIGARKFIQELFPTEQRTVQSASSCFYNMSWDKNFIIDELEPNIYLTSGWSGHAFKFWLVIGEYIVHQILWTPYAYEPIFRKQFSLSRPWLL